jgi:Ca2+-binding RTX toxin-like protein
MAAPHTEGSTKVSKAHNLCRSNNGDDVITGTLSPDKLKGGNGDDVLTGAPVGHMGFDDHDILLGGRGNDTLVGQAGDDTLKGGKGDDVLDPGEGNNVLVGGRGADTFMFGYASPGFPGSAPPNGDVIADFEQGHDTIDLSRLNQGNYPLNETYTFVSDAAFSGTRPEARAHYDAATGQTVIELDSRFGSTAADGNVDGTIILTGQYQLTAGDFIL